MLAIFCFLVCLPGLMLSESHGDTRGLSVKAHTRTGETRDILLYSGYYALVVGCGDYHAGWPRLPNPVKDACEVALVLKKLGCKVNLLKDPDWLSLRRALNKLIIGPGRDPDKAILFWFSGHGHTLKEAGGRELGYIVPVDAPNPDRDEIGFMEHAISMRQIETYARRISARHTLMLFDSCFSGAIFQAVRSKPSPYIEEKIQKPVRQFITAGNQNEQVPDESVFKTVFVQSIEDGYADRNRDGYVTGMELGDYLQEQVVNYSRGAQHPQFGKINDPALDKGDFVFSLASSGTIIDTSSPTSSPTRGRLSVTSNISGAEVIVDGRFVGRIPLSNMEVDAGPHRVQVRMDKYDTYRTTVEVTAGRTAYLEAHLTEQGPKMGRLYVYTDPADAMVRILNIHPVFIQGMTLDPGDYHVAVSATGYGEKTRWVNISAGENKQIDFRLPPVAQLPSTAKGKSIISNRLGMEFVHIQPGTFMMGQTKAEKKLLIKMLGKENYKKWIKDETRHRVTLTGGYYLQTTEVTVGQWRAFVRATGYRSEAETGDGAIIHKGARTKKVEGTGWKNPGYDQDDGFPVTCISWNDAQAFIGWLSREDSRTYRLPTEAQWEYAARAGTQTLFSFGDCMSSDQANYNGYIPMEGCKRGPNTIETGCRSKLSCQCLGAFRYARQCAGMVSGLVWKISLGGNHRSDRPRVGHAQGDSGRHVAW